MLTSQNGLLELVKHRTEPQNIRPSHLGGKDACCLAANLLIILFF